MPKSRWTQLPSVLIGTLVALFAVLFVLLALFGLLVKIVGHA